MSDIESLGRSEPVSAAEAIKGIREGVDRFNEQLAAFNRWLDHRPPGGESIDQKIADSLLEHLHHVAHHMHHLTKMEGKIDHDLEKAVTKAIDEYQKMMTMESQQRAMLMQHPEVMQLREDSELVLKRIDEAFRKVTRKPPSSSV